MAMTIRPASTIRFISFQATNTIGYYWMYQWHCFIQHIAQGQTPDAFFASLPHPDIAAESR